MMEFEKKSLELLASIKESTYGAVLAAEDIMAHVHDIEERLAALEEIKREVGWMSKVLHATACDVVEIKEMLHKQQMDTRKCGLTPRKIRRKINHVFQNLP